MKEISAFIAKQQEMLNAMQVVEGRSRRASM
jgi:hypothetical protein